MIIAVIIIRTVMLTRLSPAMERRAWRYCDSSSTHSPKEIMMMQHDNENGFARAFGGDGGTVVRDNAGVASLRCRQ